MTRIDETVYCDNCGIEITWGPVILGQQHYCCQDCQAHLKCNCGPVIDWDDEGRSSRAGDTHADVYG